MIKKISLQVNLFPALFLLIKAKLCVFSFFYTLIIYVDLTKMMRYHMADAGYFRLLVSFLYSIINCHFLTVETT